MHSGPRKPIDARIKYTIQRQLMALCGLSSSPYRMSAFGGKADMNQVLDGRLLMTLSGHCEPSQ